MAAGKPVPNLNFEDPSTKKLAPNTISILSGATKAGANDVPFFTSLRVTDPTGESLVPTRDTRGDVKWRSAMLLIPEPGNRGGLASGMDASGNQSVVQAGIATVDDTTGIETDLFVATVDPTPGESPDAILEALAADLAGDGLDAQTDPGTDELEVVHLPSADFFLAGDTDSGLEITTIDNSIDVPEPPASGMLLAAIGACAVGCRWRFATRPREVGVKA